MKSSAQIRHEVALVVMKSLAGEATPSELRGLNDLMRSDASLTPFVADLLSQEAWLAWTIARNRTSGVRQDLTNSLADSLQLEHSGVDAELTRVDRGCASNPHDSSAKQGGRRLPFMVLAASLLLTLGGLVGSLVTSSMMAPEMAGVARREDRERPMEDAGEYVARVVNATSCRWSSDVRFPVENNGVLRKGESLQLVEGIAEIRLEWPRGAANLRVEGPTGLVLTADHGCSLGHGKLTVDVETSDLRSRFAIETPNGLVELADGSSAGILVDGRDVSVHAFRGRGGTLVPWSTDAYASALPLEAGKAITLIAPVDGALEIEHGASRPSLFASQTSMQSDALAITPAYVERIRADKPILYWRFDEPAHDHVHVFNDVAERYAGTIYGSVQLRKANGNQFVEFGATSVIDSALPRIEADDFFADEVTDEYSLELWVKPNHFHLGTLVSFVDQQPVHNDTGLIESPHGFLLEIGGPRTTQTTIELPGKIRFLHRSPPSGRLLGSSCFSGLSYEPRKWQHVVVVKEGAAMRIYLNSELTGSAEDATNLAPGLRLLAGQLDRYRSARMYVGQMDELAFYPTALTPEQIAVHYQLVKSRGAVEQPSRLRQDVDATDVALSPDKI